MSQQEQIRRCVLIGFLGCGKTSIFNKLCKQSQKANSQLKSNTMKISQSYTKYGKTNFLLVDTPGMGAIDAVFTHSINMVAALTDGPINRILVVIKFDTRIDMISKQIKEVIYIVRAYSDLVTIIINNVDQCKIDKKEFYQESQNMILQKFDIKSVIFTELKADAQQLCLAIERELGSNFKQLEISDDLFNNLMSQLEFVKELEDGKQQFLEEFQCFYNSVKRFLSEFNVQNKDQDQILHSLHIFVRQHALKIQENFEKSYGNVMEEINQRKNDPILAYQYYTVLKYSIKTQVQELIEIIDKKMIYPLNHPYRNIRECPHCYVRWFKVVGCNDIYCGKKMKKNEEKEALQQIHQTYKQFKFSYINKIIQFQEIKLEIEVPSKQIKSSIKFNDDELQLIRSNNMNVYANENKNQSNDNQKHLVTEPQTPKQDIKIKVKTKKMPKQTQQTNYQYQQISNQQKQLINKNPIQIQFQPKIVPLINNQIYQKPIMKGNQQTNQQIPISQNLMLPQWDRIYQQQQFLTIPLNIHNHGLNKEEQELIQQKKQIGCGKKFNWEDAKILKLEDIELGHEQLYQFYSEKDFQYKTQFDNIKNSFIEKAKEEKQIL